MPFRPDDASELANRVRDIYVTAESLVLQKLARAIANTGDGPDWLLDRLIQQRAMLRQLDRIIADLDKGVPTAMREVVDLAYNRGVGFAVHDAEKAGVVADLYGRVRDTGTEVTLARAAIEPLGAMRFQIRRWASDTFDQVTQQAAAEVATGVINRREASARMLQRLAGRGVTGFVDRSGRRWEMASYAEMAARTTIAQASLQGHTDRLQDLGVDTVIVSDHDQECKICRPFEGRVLSISGKTTGRLTDGKSVTASLSEAKGKGLFHPGCRHSYSIYLPGITQGADRKTADQEGDALRQKQRAYERRIRELKRRDIVAQELDPTGPEARKAKADLQAKRAEFKTFRVDNGLKDLSYRTSLKVR